MYELVVAKPIHVEFGFEAEPPLGVHTIAGVLFVAPGILFALSIIHLGSLEPNPNTVFVLGFIPVLRLI